MRFINSLFISVGWAATGCRSQLVNHELFPENHPDLQIEMCNAAAGCKAQRAAVVMDADYRPFQTLKDGEDCLGSNNTWRCSSEQACNSECGLGGVSYKFGHGVTTKDDSLKMKLFMPHNRGSRVYLLESKHKYQLFYLKNREVSFAVDASQLPCGVASTMHFSSMPADGGMSDTNQAGAQYGTGYCDPQCHTHFKFIGGRANYKPPATPNSPATVGRWGACCPSMVVYEGNSMSQSFTPHTCKSPKLTPCEGSACERPLCDSSGCDFAPYRWGARDFYGPHKRVDTKQKFTVITQFITSDGTDKGDLVEIRRLYLQKGALVSNSRVLILGGSPYNSIMDDFCTDIAELTNSTNYFGRFGGLKAMGEAMEKGMVLVMSVWMDDKDSVTWLDGTLPPNSTTPGSIRGVCRDEESTPDYVGTKYPTSRVEYSRIRVGEIGSTYQTP